MPRMYIILQALIIIINACVYYNIMLRVIKLKLQNLFHEYCILNMNS